MNTKQETLGLWLGVLGVAIFAVTLPMTRLATGTAADPQLSAWFITFARAALAGGLSTVFLLVTRSPWPLSTQRLPLMMAAPPRRADAPQDQQAFVYLRPEPGTVFMWESWLRHEVPASRAKTDRISISFNYAWK